MQGQQKAPEYRYWGSDDIAYGPFEIPELVNLVLQRRITARTWVYEDVDKRWERAEEYQELKPIFDKLRRRDTTTKGEDDSQALKPAHLRRIKAFTGIGAEALESLLGYLDVVHINKFQRLFNEGDEGDAMYFILEGEMRASKTGGQREKVLFTLKPGDAFGEIALLIRSTRSSDIIANENSVLLKLPTQAFEKIVKEAPALATPLLHEVASTLAFRSLELAKQKQQASEQQAGLREVG